jgi:hypothetical protein
LTTNLAQHRSSPKRWQVNIHPTLPTFLLVIPIGLFSSSESGVKKIPHQACALALQLLQQTDMMAPATSPSGALTLVKGEKHDRTAYQIISSFMGRITSHLKGFGLAAARAWPL